jgi:hypothetical protein
MPLRAWRAISRQQLVSEDHLIAKLIAISDVIQATKGYDQPDEPHVRSHAGVA